jgi:hypothetical protein
VTASTTRLDDKWTPWRPHTLLLVGLGVVNECGDQMVGPSRQPARVDVGYVWFSVGFFVAVTRVETMVRAGAVGSGQGLGILHFELGAVHQHLEVRPLAGIQCAVHRHGTREGVRWKRAVERIRTRRRGKAYAVRQWDRYSGRVAGNTRRPHGQLGPCQQAQSIQSGLIAAVT